MEKKFSTLLWRMLLLCWTDSKLLEAKGIRYQVICWQGGGSTASTLREIIEENGCCHVGIQVSLDGQPYIIGGNFMSFWVSRVRTYTKMRSQDIIECDLYGVECDNWNYRYDRKLNGRFTSILAKAVRK